MRRFFIVPVLAGLLLTVAACGAKEDTTSTAPSTAASKSSSESDSKTATTETSSSSDDEEEADGDSSDSTLPDLGDVPGVSDECAALVTVYTGIMAQSAKIFDPSADTSELESLVGQIDEAKADMPDEIKEDFEVWAEAWTEFAATMQDISKNGGMMDPGNIAKLDEASKKLDDPKVDEANKNISDYAEANCQGFAGGLIPDN